MDAQELIMKMKSVKQQRKISYGEIIDQLTVNGTPTVSMTTLRRVFAAGSEDRASSFNYEATLLPIAEAMRKLAGCPDESAHEEEISRLKDKIHGYKDQISALNDKIDQKDALIERLIDRLEQKDNIIRQFLIDMKQKDEIIKHIMEKDYENTRTKEAPIR